MENEIFRIQACKMIKGKSEDVYISEITGCTMEEIKSLRENLNIIDVMTQETKQEYRNEYKHKKYIKVKLTDTQEQKSYYFEKEIVKIIDDLAGDDTGFKYRFVNEAIKVLIHQEYPEYVGWLKKDNNDLD